MNLNPSFQRLAILTGQDAAAALLQTKAAVFGLGGVGSWCAEALVRSGVGNIVLVDFDTVEISNINRQAEATAKTIGRQKTEALAARLREINPDCAVVTIPEYFSCKDNNMEKAAEHYQITGADYIIDAIDTIESKLDLIECAACSGITLFSSMGMARKMDPTRLKTADIWKTSGCPLARSVREGLRKRGFNSNFTVVYSDEKPFVQYENYADKNPVSGKKSLGSAVTVTASAGMILASLVIRDVCRKCNNG